MQDPFDQKKAQILGEISSSSQDASPKGSIDEKCIPLMNLINSDNDMVSTSSCSGRVSVFVEGIKQTERLKIGAKGDGGHWLFVSHDTENLDKWWENRMIFKSGIPEIDQNSRFAIFKFEPLIFHVKCRNLESAQRLYVAAMNCGFRESGIGKNNVVAIRISIKLDAPVGIFVDGSVVSLVSQDYLAVLTKLSLDRFEENTRKLNQLYKEIEGFEKPEKKVETKEQRRERKIREGLARQALLKKDNSSEGVSAAE